MSSSKVFDSIFNSFISHHLSTIMRVLHSREHPDEIFLFKSRTRKFLTSSYIGWHCDLQQYYQLWIHIIPTRPELNLRYLTYSLWNSYVFSLICHYYYRVGFFKALSKFLFTQAASMWMRLFTCIIISYIFILTIIYSRTVILSKELVQ